MKGSINTRLQAEYQVELVRSCRGFQERWGHLTFRECKKIHVKNKKISQLEKDLTNLNIIS